MTEYPAIMADEDADTIRLKLEGFADAKRMSLRELSVDTLGKKPGYLSDFIRKKSPVRLDMADALKLAGVLEVLPAELGVEHVGPVIPSPDVANRKQSSLEFVRDGHRLFEGKRDLPILGYVKAGELGFFIDNGSRQGVTVRPEALRDVNDAYAVRVHDESMEEALSPGYLVFVDPHRTPRPNDYVVIQMRDGQSFIKKLLRRSQKAILCKQFNPAKEIKYDPAKVKSVHMVVQISVVDL